MTVSGRDDGARALFDFLERDGLAYCVLADTRDYPASIRSDLDIAVRHENLGRSQPHRAHARRGQRHRALAMVDDAAPARLRLTR